ncbi:hypothetical protein ACFT1A_28430 [Rhodococcus sp. NPDC057135]|uniref:hypothetical protein n=1 Tax=Rhodococcus sp. NPDC057135 TaxID=3346028 RepID=UPI003629A831
MNAAESADDDRIRTSVVDGHGRPSDLLNSVLTRTVAFVEALKRKAEACDPSATAEAAHVRHLSETVSGVVLDFVREWPT